MGGFGKGFVTVCLGFVLPGCGLYDAIWGNEVAQKRVAEHRAPAALKREGDAPARPAAIRTLRMRVYATPRYAVATLDWQRQFAGVVLDVNPTLRADFGVELEVVEHRTFADAGSEDSLPELLHGLALLDPGHDVDWVVALVTAVPGLAESPDEIGLAATPGKHLVLRAMSDPDEFDAIERGFPDLPRAEREKLHAARKRHKAAIVLLHELGHTLGIPHEKANDALMNPYYSHRASDFSAEAVRIGNAELARRLSTAPVSPRSASPTAADTRAPPVESPVPVVEGLSEDDSRTFHAAVARQQEHELDEARRLATPLFSRHENVYAVQKLRCDLATALGGSWESIKKECEPFMRLPSPQR